MKKKITIVMPAYNAQKTLERTFRDIPQGSYDDIILVDDASQDDTVSVARSLNLIVISHKKNRGYGGNQKTCYKAALDRGADIIVMLHPDYQYDPTAIPRIVDPLRRGEADMVIASRFLRESPYRQGMPFYKYIANTFLTYCQNKIFRQHISEYHSGYRAYTRNLLETIPFETFSENFVFDSQMLAEAAGRQMRLSEIDIPTRYFEEASQTSFKQSLRYGLSTLGTLFTFVAQYRTTLSIALVVLLAFGSALFWSSLYPQGRPLGGDALEFHSLALGIKERLEFGGGEWFAKENPSMWREPGYPTFLAVLYTLAGIGLYPLLATQSFLFATSAVLLFLALKNITKPSIAGLTSILYAIHPSIGLRAGYVGSDLLFTIGIVVILWISTRYPPTRKQAALIGLAIGVSSLIRTIGILLPIAFLAYLFFLHRPKKEKVILACTMFVIFLLVVTPWMIRNAVHFGEFTLTNRSGLMLHSRSAPLTTSGNDYTYFIVSSFWGDYITRKIFPEYSPEKARFLSGLESRDRELYMLTKESIAPSLIDARLKEEGMRVIVARPLRYMIDAIPWLARLNAPIIPRSSAQALFVTSQKETHEFLKILIIVLLRGTMYIFLFLVLYSITNNIRHPSPWQLWCFLIIILNLGYAAFAPVERFSMPLYPLYIPLALEGVRVLYINLAQRTKA